MCYDPYMGVVRRQTVKSVYDSIYREKLLGSMTEFDIPPKLIRLVKINNDQCAMLSLDRVSPVGANIYRMRGEARRCTCMPFSILCLTTHLIHQGHEKRKEIRDVSTFTAQHVRAAFSVLHMAQKIVSRQKHNMLPLLHAACLKLLVF